MTVPAELAATLVDEWVRAGVAAAVLAPGSRSAPLATALLADGRLPVHVRLDERSAAYFALGLALSSGRPVAVVTTSGTAAAELHPAVLEADLAGVPLLCVTADRPPELQRVGAPQTVRQEGLFGSAVRFACSPGLPEEGGRSHWRSLAARLVLEATASPAGPGPVHCNLAFREPLVTPAGPLPPGRPGGAPWHAAAGGPGCSAEAVAGLLEWAGRGRAGMVVAGAGAGGRGGRAAVLTLAGALGWPVLADPRAWPREPAGEGELLVGAADALLRSPRARERLAPERVLRLGAPPASRVVATWLAGLPAGARQLLVDPFGRWQDPERQADLVVRADPVLLAAEAAGAAEAVGAAGQPGQPVGRGNRPGWAEMWAAAESAAQAAIGELLEGELRTSEPGLARALFAGVPAGSALFASSSMPVRDLEWFAAPRAGAPEVLANRGANGIDGVTSTALGVAAQRAATGAGPTYGLLGDLAFLHDLSALVWGSAEQLPPVTLVVIDNGGGGIFSFLPYAAGLAPGRFERAFGTPQRPALAPLAAALGAEVAEVEGSDRLADALAPPAGVRVVLARSDRQANLAAHERLERAAVAAVEEALREA